MKRHYIIAMVTIGHSYQRVYPLDVGKRYTLHQAKVRAEELNKTCQPELKVLDYQCFTPYNISKPT